MTITLPFWRILTILAPAVVGAPTWADGPSADLAGTYNGSQMEVGTELRLEANGRYEYYLSYGAMDEMSEGAWAADGEAIILTSDPFKAPAFALVGSEPGNGSTLDVTLDVPEELPLQLFSSLLIRPDRTASEAQFDGGALQIPLTGANRPTKFVLGLEIYNVMSDLYDIPSNTRSMHFRFVPNELGKVAFDRTRLPRDGDSFVLERFGRTLKFRKEAHSDDREGQEPRETEEK